MPKNPARTTTLDQVADRAGVSRSAASRAINNAPYVSRATKLAVEQAVRDLGYVPNSAARALASRHAGAVILAIANEDARIFADPFFGEVALGITTALEKTDLDLLLVLAHGQGGRARLQRTLRAPRADGIMLLALEVGDPILAAASASGLPVVVCGQPLDSSIPFYVDADNEGGGRLAANHLMAIGRRRLAVISGPQDTQAGVARHRGFCDTLTLAGWGLAGAQFSDFTRQGGITAMRRLLEDHPDIDGVFAASDNMAAGALHALRTHGRSVPEDVAVVGFDDLPVAQHTDPELTTIHQPIQQLGLQMANMLISAMDGGSPSPLILPTRLVVRASAPL